MRASRDHKAGALVGIAVAAAIIGGGLVAKDQLESGARQPASPPAARIPNLLNQQRAHAGLLPLKRDLVLAALARAHNRNMRSGDWFAHDDPQGQTFSERLGYLHRLLVGEVLAYGTAGFAEPAGIVSLWMSSPGHRRVILTPGMRRVGISVLCGRFLNEPGVCLATADLSS